MKNRIAIIGENAVQNALQKIIVSKGFEGEIVSPSEKGPLKSRLKHFDCIVLPFPSRDDNISFIRENDCSELFSEKQLIVGGLVSEELKEHLESNGSDVYDYFKDNAYVLKNAYLTYQGVIRLLLESTDTFLPGRTALVTGFGRIAKPLSLTLKSLGIKVYVAVRSDIQIAEAEMMGFDVLRINNIKSTLFYFDFIFNTVPFNIFSEKDVKHLKNSSVYFEIASKPYGAQGENFGIYGKKYVLASALPGKLYPFGVAENIADFLSRKEVI